MNILFWLEGRETIEPGTGQYFSPLNIVSEHQDQSPQMEASQDGCGCFVTPPLRKLDTSMQEAMSAAALLPTETKLQSGACNLLVVVAV